MHYKAKFAECESQTVISGNLDDNTSSDDTPTSSDGILTHNLLLSIHELTSKNDDLIKCIEKGSAVFRHEVAQQFKSLAEQLVSVNNSDQPKLTKSDNVLLDGIDKR